MPVRHPAQNGYKDCYAITNKCTEYKNTEIWPRPYMTEDQADEVSFLWPDVKAVITEYETKFVKGELEINDTNWQAYMKALYKADINTLVDILQEAYDASQGK